MLAMKVKVVMKVKQRRRMPMAINCDQLDFCGGPTQGEWLLAAASEQKDQMKQQNQLLMIFVYTYKLY